MEELAKTCIRCGERMVWKVEENETSVVTKAICEKCPAMQVHVKSKPQPDYKISFSKIEEDWSNLPSI